MSTILLDNDQRILLIEDLIPFWRGFNNWFKIPLQQNDVVSFNFMANGKQAGHLVKGPSIP